MRKKKEGKEMETAGMMRWLLTYADMITLLLAMFILLYAISKINQKKYQEVMQIAAKVIGKKNISAVEEASVEKLESKLQNAQEKLKKIIEDKNMREKIQLMVEERGIRISFQTDGIFFDLGKADLTEDFQSILGAMATTLKEIPNSIRVEGHICDMPINTVEFPSNWELSTRRATNVLRYLIEEGVPGEKMAAAGYAETRPIAPNDCEENRVKNRRVDIIILRSEAGDLEPKKQTFPAHQATAGTPAPAADKAPAQAKPESQSGEAPQSQAAAQNPVSPSELDRSLDSKIPYSPSP
jgi:chemotaxis protein MotB